MNWGNALSSHKFKKNQKISKNKGKFFFKFYRYIDIV